MFDEGPAMPKVARWSKVSRSMLVPSLMALAVAACGGDSGGPGAGGSGAIGQVVSPNGSEGAAIIEFAGAVDSIVVTGGRAYLQTGGGRTRAALVLDQPGNIQFRLPRVTGAAPSATVVQVAGGDNQLRASVAGYQVAYGR